MSIRVPHLKHRVARREVYRAHASGCAAACLRTCANVNVSLSTLVHAVACCLTRCALHYPSTTAAGLVQHDSPGLGLPREVGHWRAVDMAYESRSGWSRCTASSPSQTMHVLPCVHRDIQANFEAYDGFVVLHGTDTMAFTASAMSFMFKNLSKTVIITGSQISMAFPVRDICRQ